jgi:hypothetical protein
MKPATSPLAQVVKIVATQQMKLEALEARNRVLHRLLDAFEKECAGRASDPLAAIIKDYRQLKTNIKNRAAKEAAKAAL